MHDIKVNKAELIAKIDANRNQHREQFLRAQEKYREAVIAELDRRLQEARDGKPIKRGFSLPEPQDYTSSYDEALSMLEWEVEEEITLDQRSFRELVLNDWGWKDQFAAATQSYLAQ